MSTREEPASQHVRACLRVAELCMRLTCVRRTCMRWTCSA
jgi:hypothetical protein